MKKHPENNLRKLRLQRGLTLERLAEMVEPQTSADTISKLELGQRGLDHEWMIRLSKPLRCDVRDFIGEIDNNKRTGLRDIDIALIYVIKDIIKITFNKKPALRQRLRRDLIYALDHFRDEKLSDAERVMDDLLAFVEGEAHQERPQTIRKPLQLVPPV